MAILPCIRRCSLSRPEDPFPFSGIDMKLVTTILSVSLLALGASTANAQLLSVTPRAGAYSSVENVSEAVKEYNRIRSEQTAKLGVGLTAELNIPLFPIDVRVGGDYVTGATVSREGLNGSVEVAEGSLLYVSADAVFRPIPRLLIVQPYVLGGAAFKRDKFVRTDAQGFAEEIKDGYKDFQLHAGAGFDVTLGGLGVAVEVTDYFARPEDTSTAGLLDLKHDFFATVGLKIPVF